ncbi:MAG: prepilin-type N-terminal cleavage/methylation domain-containing protein [Armatimonadetes bacterium]|nr:prepilin-type N-terminal cleavage/methylation domain-containing protein [Armatimonadota bacterium]
MSAVSKGFTMVEVLVACVLMSIGVVAVMRSAGQISATQAVLRQRETGQHLANGKLQEIVALGNIEQADTEGDFKDNGYSNFKWTAQVTPSGIENLDLVRVTVTKDGTDQNESSVAESLAYVAPAATGGAQ